MSRKKPWKGLRVGLAAHHEQIIKWGGSILDPGKKKSLFIVEMSPAVEN